VVGLIFGAFELTLVLSSPIYGTYVSIHFALISLDYQLIRNIVWYNNIL
jgi:hypothetical protein